jgi:hypothetical protein
MDNLHKSKQRANMQFAYQLIETVGTNIPAPEPVKPKSSWPNQSQINELWERMNKLEAKFKIQY